MQYQGVIDYFISEKWIDCSKNRSSARYFERLYFIEQIRGGKYVSETTAILTVHVTDLNIILQIEFIDQYGFKFDIACEMLSIEKIQIEDIKVNIDSLIKRTLNILKVENKQK